MSAGSVYQDEIGGSMAFHWLSSILDIRVLLFTAAGFAVVLIIANRKSILNAFLALFAAIPIITIPTTVQLVLPSTRRLPSGLAVMVFAVGVIVALMAFDALQEGITITRVSSHDR